MMWNNRFPVLSAIAKVLFIVGVVVLIGGLYSGVLIAMEFSKLSGNVGANWSFEIKDYIKMFLFVFCTLGGLITMAIAECIGVMFSIEKNTRCGGEISE